MATEGTTPELRRKQSKLCELQKSGYEAIASCLNLMQKVECDIKMVEGSQPWCKHCKVQLCHTFDLDEFKDKVDQLMALVTRVSAKVTSHAEEHPTTRTDSGISSEELKEHHLNEMSALAMADLNIFDGMNSLRSIPDSISCDSNC